MSDLPDLPTLEGGIYEHYKGKLYEVVDVACHSETLEPMVVYRPLYDSNVKLFVRPYNMFIEAIENGGNTTPRFKKVNG